MKNVPFWPMLIGTGFGSGFCPMAPGTAGALLATIIWAALVGLFPYIWVVHITFALVIIFTILGIWAANRLETCWGEDPSRVVVDEMVGVWIPLLVVPADNLWYYGIAAFVLFRLFDIFKPLGIRKMEDLPGGIGVMMDDILSGIYALLILLLVRYWLG